MSSEINYDELWKSYSKCTKSYIFDRFKESNIAYHSTRQALADTKAQLEALEDILLAFENCEFLSDKQNEAHYEAIANSRARKQNG